jgi:HK97 gp10 family phage protein
VASPRLELELRGLADLEVRVSRWEVRKIAAMRALVKNTANNIRRNAKRRAPVVTGRLRKSISVKYADDKLTAFVRAVAPYAHIVENGSAVTGASPKPFIEPAFQGQKEKYEQKLRRILGEV